MTAFWGASEAWLLFHELRLDSIKVVALYSFLNKIGGFRRRSPARLLLVIEIAELLP
jgi:hypothetical protein